MSKEPPAFVRWGSRQEQWSSLEAADKAAKGYALKHRNLNFYTGYVGSDPRTHSRWAWDDDWSDAIRFACND